MKKSDPFALIAQLVTSGSNWNQGPATQVITAALFATAFLKSSTVRERYPFD
jgi:hypothetical protein